MCETFNNLSEQEKVGKKYDLERHKKQKRLSLNAFMHIKGKKSNFEKRSFMHLVT